MRTIPLTKGKEAIVDDDMFDFLNQWKWHAAGRNSNYARRTPYVNPYKSESLYMHHVVSGYPLKKLQIDHLNGNSLDNRRENHAIVTNRQNNSNKNIHRIGLKSSNFVGVNFCRERSNWMASIRINGQKKNLGRFKDECEAAIAYQSALRKANGN